MSALFVRGPSFRTDNSADVEREPVVLSDEERRRRLRQSTGNSFFGANSGSLPTDQRPASPIGRRLK